MNVGLCASAPGTLAAMDVVSFNHAGTAVGSNVGVFFRLMYPASAKSLVDWDVVTHAPPGKPFRGPGGPPAFFALEQSVDEVAFQRGEDPLALRRRWDVHKIRQHLYGWVETLPLWTDRGSVASDRGRFRRGVGLAAGTWFHFVGAHAQVQVSSAPDGFVVSCGTQDMGNGTRSSLAAGVSEVLGVPASDIEVRIGDSDFVQGPLSAGSRTTCTVVPAAIQAASSLRDDLLAHAVRQFSLQDAKAGSGGIDHAQGHLPWSQVLASAPPLSSLGRRPRDDGGYFFPFSLAGIHVGKALTAIVTVMEVEVDSRLGRVRPVEVFAGLAAGRIVLPHLARSQVEGALIQGLSYSLYEERRMDPQTGRLLSGGLESYRIAGVGDTPKLHVHFEERGFDHVEGRILGLSELATVTVAATVGNAVHHATGWRPRHLPLRCDRVVEGLKA